MACPICLEPCETDVLITECCHQHFHTSCHAECMKMNPACPMCRAVAVEIKEKYFVEVRVPILFWIVRSMVFCFVVCIVILFFIGFMMYTIITQYENGSNSTNATSV